MNQHEIQNYLSFQRQQQQKQEDACPLFYGGLAVVDSRFRVLAERGLDPREGREWALSAANLRLLSDQLTARNRVAVRNRSKILLFSGELLPLGLFAVLLPPGAREDAAGVLCYLSGSGGVTVTPSVRKCAAEPDPAEVMAAENELQLLDTVLRPAADIPLSESCRCVAGYAGCAVRLENPEAFRRTVPGCDRLRLTAFLLCAFLSLRRLDPDGPTLTVRDADTGPELVITYRLPGQPAAEDPFPFLRDPAFRGAFIDPPTAGVCRLRCAIDACTPARFVL